MKIKVTLVAIALLLSGCSSTSSLDVLRDTSPPKDIDNVCSILGEKPSWNNDLNAVKKKYGVPAHVILAMMHQESRFVHDARPLAKGLKGIFDTHFASSAYGYSQALEMTWAHYMRATGRSGAKRDRFEDAVDFMGWYINESNENLKLSKWDAEVQYLAYHEGHGGYKKRTYRKKPWLVKTAKRVKNRSDMYWEQFQKCGMFFSEDKNWFARYFL